MKKFLLLFLLAFLFSCASFTELNKSKKAVEPAKPKFKLVMYSNNLYLPDEEFKQNILERIKNTGYIDVRWGVADRLHIKYISYAYVYYWLEGEERDITLIEDDLIGRWVGIAIHERLEVRVNLDFIRSHEEPYELEGMVEIDPEGQDFYTFIKAVRFKDGILKFRFHVVYQNIDYRYINIILYVTKEKFEGIWECPAAKVQGKVRLERWVGSLTVKHLPVKEQD